jgi:PAS domain S-box-containing protein
MNIRRQFSVGKQIIALPFVALIGFAFVLLILYFGMAAQRQQDEKISQRLIYLRSISVIQLNLSIARNHEKKFFDTRDTKHIINFQYAVSAALSQIDEIVTDKRYTSQNPTIESWEADIQRYLGAFNQMVKELGLIGRFANTGLRGAMREAVHIVEQQLKNEDPKYQILLLELRRREKDVLLRDKNIYVTAWVNALSNLKLKIDGAQIGDEDKGRILESLNLYELEFAKLRDVLADIQADKQEVDQISLDLTNSLSTEVLKLETEATNAIMRGSQETGREFRNAVLFTVLIGAIVFLFGRWVGNGIRHPMAIISGEMNRLAQGDFDTKTSVEGYTNEFGTMATSVETFRDNAIERRRVGFQLREANRQTQGVIRAMQEALFEISPDGKILMTNPAAENLLGMKSGDLIGQNLTDYFADQSSPAEEARFSQMKLNLESLCREDPTAFDKTLREAPIPALLVDSDGIIEIASEKSAETFGYSQEEMTGLSIKALMSAKDWHGHDKYLKQPAALNGGRMMSQGRKLAAVMRDGTEFEVSIGLIPMKFGKKDGFVCLLRREGVDVGLVNLAGTKFGQLFAGVDLDRSFEHLLDGAEKHQTRTEYMVRADGQSVPVQYTVALLQNDGGRTTGAICVVRDVTTQIAADAEILKFKQALELSQDEIYMFRTKSLKFIYQNQSARALSGWSKKQYLKKTPMDNNSKFNPEEFRDLAKPLHEGITKQVVYQKIGKNNRPIEVSLQLVKLGDGEELYIAFTRNISDRLAAQKAKTDFISTVSHELRTPLTSIKGALGIIHAGAVGEVGDKTNELISMALKNSNRLERLIDDILDTEKIEAGQMDYIFEPVDLGDLVKEALLANEGYAKAHNIKFVARGVDKPVHILGDPDRLMQILANLMSNAAKFSKTGGVVEVSLVQSKRKVRLSVKDNGCGIPESAQPTIFDKFTQADSSDTKGKGGTGLGLSIVKTMVQAHDGVIDFKSKKGKGSEFFIDFNPLETAA